MAARVITVAQQKGGAGKTTVSAHLALALTALGEKVALIDIDPQGSLGQWFRLRQAALGAKTLVTLTTVNGWRVGGEIERVAQDHQYVIIDSPPHAETEAKAAIRAAGVVVVPVQPSPLDLWATKPTIDIALEARVPTLLVLNRLGIKSPLKEEAERTLAQLGAHVARARIGNRSGFATSMAEGLGIGETSPNSAGAREMRNLAREAMALMGTKR